MFSHIKTKKVCLFFRSSHLHRIGLLCQQGSSNLSRSHVQFCKFNFQSFKILASREYIFFLITLGWFSKKRQGPKIDKENNHLTTPWC